MIFNYSQNTTDYKTILNNFRFINSLPLINVSNVLGNLGLLSDRLDRIKMFIKYSDSDGTQAFIVYENT